MLAANQSRPPAEIIIIDASDNWIAGKTLVQAALAESGYAGRFIYHNADVRSSAAQRNAAIRISRADILFLIDDDSLLHPECAAEVMRIYEIDHRCEIGAVAIQRSVVSPINIGGAVMENDSSVKKGRLRKFIRTILDADNIFVPYDPVPPIKVLSFYDPAIGITASRRNTIAGYCLTERRDFALREPFCEQLTYYAAGEDSDQTYRISRHGLLVNALRAKLFHASSPGGRLPKKTVATLGALNPAFLHRLYSTNMDYSAREIRRLIVRRCLIAFVKEMTRCDFRFRECRGLIRALWILPRLFKCPSESLAAWYVNLQRKIVGHKRKKVGK